ncbi:MAG: signal peptidase I [Gemmatimonadetes bacterium]|nr:signal peptidase I [Gemmatimonadota bacterium]
MSAPETDATPEQHRPAPALPDPEDVRPAGGGASAFAQSLWEWAKSVGFAFLLFLVIRTFLIQAFKIPTGSMEETLLIGDFLLVNKAVYGAQIPGTPYRLPAFEHVRRQDVVVFEYPDPYDEYDTDPDYVKRVIGAPGDTVQMVQKRMYVNGEPLSEPYARQLPGALDPDYDPHFDWQRNYLSAGYDPSAYRATRDTWGPIVVPPGKYFVLGDNRDNSADSRYWGFVDADLIKGKPLVVYFSKRSDELIPEFEDIRYKRIGSVIK